MDAIKQAQSLVDSGIAPVAEYVAAAGPDYGWVKVWKRMRARWEHIEGEQK